MTLWYDVSDLMGWHLPHLTGIQRTTVGILNGLVAQGVRIRLTSFDKASGGFVPIDVSAFPPVICRHLPWTTDSHALELVCGDGSIGHSFRRVSSRSPDRMLGKSAAAQELRLAFREFKAATSRLCKKAARWSRVRCAETVTQVPLARTVAGGDPGRLFLSRSTTRPSTLPAVTTAGPMVVGDVLLSLGASWIVPRHDAAAAALRRHGVRVVRMIYDLIPTLKPQWVDDPDANVNVSGPVTQWARNIITESDGVLTISEFSRRDILRFCTESGVRSAPVSVVRLGDVLEPTVCGEPPLPRTVPSRPFFLCVSTLDIRKNHRLLYDAWCVLADRDYDLCPDLVCVGTPHVYVRDLLREIRSDRQVNQRIHILRDVADEELAWYYRHCAATIYPSRYEGWGLPVAESLGHGRLCLASNATSIPEISADLPEFFDPLDVHGLVGLVLRTLNDREWVEAREAEIRQRFVATPWSHTAAQVLAAVEAVVSAPAVRAA